MILLPAIDIKDGTCVRLQKGDYQTAHKVAENPLETALSFQKAGAEWIPRKPSGRPGRSGSIWWIWMALKTPLW